jgi:hypothetical protein
MKCDVEPRGSTSHFIYDVCGSWIYVYMYAYVYVEEDSKGDEVDAAVAGFELEWSAGLAV